MVTGKCGWVSKAFTVRFKCGGPCAVLIAVEVSAGPWPPGPGPALRPPCPFSLFCGVSLVSPWFSPWPCAAGSHAHVFIFI